MAPICALPNAPHSTASLWHDSPRATCRLAPQESTGGRNATHIDYGGDWRRSSWKDLVAVGASVCVISLSMALVVGTTASEASAAAADVGGGSLKFPWEQAKQVQEEPTRGGTCATCIGVVDDTLGTCSATPNCVSSFDDRPKFFVAPWEFPGKLEAAVNGLREALLRSGATIKVQGERYIYAVFKGEDGIYDDVEFLFSDPSVDATVNVRAASRAVNFKDSGRNRKRLESLRMSLDWEQVPILRNRQRRLFFIESPWDTFGPEPPPTFNYKDGLEFVPE